MSKSDERDHLEGIEDALGCAEIWERLSEYREEEDGSTSCRRRRSE